MQVPRPPIAFAVANARVAAPFPSGSDVLWMADVKACRHAVQMRLFKDVLFVESDGVVFVYGLEAEDGRPPGLREDLANKQHAFVQFLRDETRLDLSVLGELAGLFDGAEYGCEGKVTAAYIAHRGEPLRMAIGYRTFQGTYETISLDPNEGGWLERALSTVSFDEIDR